VRSYHPELYGPDTPRELIDFFEDRLEEMQNGDNYFHLCERYRIHYGDAYSGRAWDRVDTGSLTMSEDPIAFMLLYNSRSETGPAVMVSNIVKIELTHGNTVLYRHPRFHTHDEDPPVVVAQVPEQRAARCVRIGRVKSGKRAT